MTFTRLNDIFKPKLLRVYTKYITSKSKKKHLVASPHPNCLCIGLIYTYNPAMPHQTDAIAQVVQKLQTEQQTIKVLCYLPDTKTQLNPNMPFDTIKKDQINLVGKSKHIAFNNFLKTPFTHLYHLDTVSNAILDYTIAKCAAMHKIGHYQTSRQHLFDIMFKDLVSPSTQTPDTFSKMIDKMFHYIQTI